MNATSQQLVTNNNQLFLKTSIESFLTSSLDHLFDNKDVAINIPSQTLPTYSATNIESISNYLREWTSLYNQFRSTKHSIEEAMLQLLYKLRGPFMSLLIICATEYKKKKNIFPNHRTLRSLITDKMKIFLNITERHERRYWTGMWRLIELLHLTQCSGIILVKAGITLTYITTASNEEYNQFLSNLLNDDSIYHKAPKFNVSTIEKVIGIYNLNL
jgi:hypothetical protein